MSEVPIYLRAPTTGRSASELAYACGYRSVESFAKQLPENAQVLDVGAGFSWLGVRVAEQRPDITWRNVDYMYCAENIETLNKRAPENVQHIQGDAQMLTDLVAPESQDLVFSYWVMSHLSLHDPDVARRAGQQMHTVAKPGASLTVGPKHLRYFWGAQTFTWQKTPELSAEQFADEAYEATLLRGLLRVVQLRHNDRRTGTGVRLPGDSEAAVEKESTLKLLGELGETFADVAKVAVSYTFWSMYFKLTRQLVVENEVGSD